MLALLATSLLACDPKPRVSPWGTRKLPPLGAFVERPDIERSLAAIETEADATGLRIASTARVEDRQGTPFVVLALTGRDRLGNAVTAARVASPWGVVLALGPAKEGDDPRAPTQLVPFLEAGPGRSVKLPADLTADGHPEIVVAGAGDAFAVYTLEAQGATELASDLRGKLSGVVARERGYGLLAEESLSPSAAPLGPRLTSLATLEGGRFRSVSKDAGAWHAEERDVRAGAREGEDDRARLSRALEHAWHAARAGASTDEALSDLGGMKAPSDLADAWRVAQKELRERLASRPRPRAQSSSASRE